MDEIDQLGLVHVYEIVSEEECWESAEKRPVHVKWTDISNRDGVKHEC